MATSSEEEPTERTSLLGESIAPISQSDARATAANGVLGASGPIKRANIGDGDGDTDEEAGAAEEVENPMFEGNPEVMRKMHLLFPVVCIGVCIFSSRSLFISVMFISILQRFCDHTSGRQVPSGRA